MKQQKATPRQKLRAAIDRCCVARGEAQWTNGYRGGAHKGDDAELYQKEMAQWRYVGAVEKRLETAINRYTTAIRRKKAR